MIHSHYLHKAWSKLLAKVPSKISIFEFLNITVYIVDVDLRQRVENQKKSSLLSQTVKDGETKNDIVNISVCGRTTDLVQYTTDSSCIEDYILKLVRKWSLSGAIQILVIVLSFIRTNFPCTSPNLERSLKLLLFCACNGTIKNVHILTKKSIS